jgi:hypothetical protein
MAAHLHEAAIASASLNGLDYLSRAVWQGLAGGAIADADAQHLAEMIQHRRQPARDERKPCGDPAWSPIDLSAAAIPRLA